MIFELLLPHLSLVYELNINNIALETILEAFAGHAPITLRNPLLLKLL